MLILKAVIEITLIDNYEKTNDIDIACKLTEEEFKGFKLIKETNDSCYNILIYSSINNSYIDNLIINKK